MLSVERWALKVFPLPLDHEQEQERWRDLLCQSRKAPETLRPAHVGAGPRVDLHRLTFLDEERDVDGLARLEDGRLRHVRCGVAAETFRRFRHL